MKFYSTQFPLVEVDSTYYFPPSEKNSELWVERTPKDFTFNIKAFSLLTQHPTKPEALYKDMVKPDKKSIYPGDLEPQVVDEVWDRFLSALQPLEEAGKLGVLLFQFPTWFTISKKNKVYVLECAKRAAPLRISVEFRNKTWMEERNVSETLDFLEGHDLPYVCVDMPQGFTSSLPPVVAATSDLAMIRFHGHNADEWESGSVQRRFAYLYSSAELKGWVPKIEKLTGEAKETHILMNNCYSRLRAEKREGARRSLRRRKRLLTHRLDGGIRSSHPAGGGRSAAQHDHARGKHPCFGQEKREETNRREDEQSDDDAAPSQPIG